MEINQKLGIKVFYYYVSQNLSFGILTVTVAIIVASLRESLIPKFDYIFSLNTSILIVGYLIWTLFIISAFLIIGGIFISWMRYVSSDFTLGENALNIRRGLLTKKEISIPYRQIQNISIEQSFTNKMRGVGKLLILTDGDTENKTSQGVFDVIDYTLAHQIREYILARTNFQVVKEDSKNLKNNK